MPVLTDSLLSPMPGDRTVTLPDVWAAGGEAEFVLFLRDGLAQAPLRRISTHRVVG
jgi:hypothetical protein